MRMSTPWQVGAGGDLAARIHHVGRVHSAFLAGRPVEPGSSGTREVVLRSWARSARAGVDLDGTAQVVLADGDLADCRAAHPLARVSGVLRELVGGPAWAPWPARPAPCGPSSQTNAVPASPGRQR